PPPPPPTWTVTNDSDDPDDTGSLRYAINHALDGTTINFAASAQGTITLIHGALEITTNLDIEGLGVSALTIDGNNATTVFEIDPNVTATIAELTITDGNSTVYAGGILNRGTLTLTDTRVANCSAQYGGGINNQGRMTITDSTITNNSTTGVGWG